MFDWILRSFYDATDWNYDNSYSNLNHIAESLLDFPIRKGVNVNCLSLASGQFASQFGLAAVPVLSGNLTYIYSTKDFDFSQQSGFHGVVPSYRRARAWKPQLAPYYWEIWQQGKRIDQRDQLLYGRMFLPQNVLEGMWVRRRTPTDQVVIRCLSDPKLKHPVMFRADYQHDVGKWCSELVYTSTDSIIGYKGLWNFGPDLRKAKRPLDPTEPQGQLSAGGEFYYGLSDKIAGLSSAIRYSTLGGYNFDPITMTLIINPLMGHVAASYATKKLYENTAFCTRYTFNAFSYESKLDIGAEIWNHKGVVKVRAGTDGSTGISWESQWKSVLLSFGIDFGFEGINTLGIQLKYHH